MRILDAFCCQGAASKGYVDAGFEVVGVDIDPQPRYPHEFYQGDAVQYIRDYGHEFDAIHASPPCQRYSKAQRIRDREHPDLIGPTREALIAAGVPYVIENVEDACAELVQPAVLCGAFFGLRTYRHRLFETSFHLELPLHFDHLERTVKMGRAITPGDFYHAVGNFSGVDYVRTDLGVPWMNRDGIRECIPPVYAEFIGRRLMAFLRASEVAA
jgi:DNA (cytosine-5)-methyltransferase 1